MAVSLSPLRLRVEHAFLLTILKNGGRKAEGAEMSVDMHITASSTRREGRGDALNAEDQSEIVCRLKGNNLALDNLRRALEDDEDNRSGDDRPSDYALRA